MPAGVRIDEPGSTFRVLILGDGNFSFSAALCRILWPRETDSATTEANAHVAHTYLGLPFPGAHHNFQIITTSFDDHTELLKKYPESKEILEFLQSSRLAELGVKVLHGVNAWELRDQFGTEEKFNVVIWNHPHLGTEDFRLHRFLMAHFFQSVASVLSSNPGSCVCVSLVEGQETRWDCVAQAARSDLGLSQIALFDETLWPGYVVKRNKHGGSFKNLHTKKHTGSEMKSHLLRFAFGLAKVEWKGLSATPIDQALTANGGHSSTQTSKLGVVTVGDSVVKAGAHSQQLAVEMDVKPCSPAAKNPSRANAKMKRMAAVPKDLKCPHCNKHLDSARGYTQHVHMVHTLLKFGADWTPVRDRTLQCTREGCEKIFADEQDRWQHDINKHTTVTSAELPSAVDQLSGSGAGGERVAAADDYDYVPCDVCGQAVVKRDWGMQLHLETLKPAVGMDMRCPIDGCNLKFIESRALFQHYKFCRQKLSSKTADVV
ncbi:hypothetical protein HDU89_004904 [Geranomyces variabilis]|nr:hypothetical protein HDU89_004904 [Geranomyces variabilis]